MASSALDYSGGNGPAFLQRGGVAEVVLLVVQVAGALVGTGALGRGVPVGGGTAADPGRDLRGLPRRILRAWSATHSSAAGSPLSKKDQAAFHKYSRTWMKSMTTVTVMPRLAASVVTVSICVLFPSTRTTHSRLCCRSRRSASSKAAAMTAGMSSVTEAVSHFPRACGSRGFCLPFGLPGLRLVLPSLLRGGADDVPGGARDRGGVVNAGQLGHPLAAVLLAGRQPGRELALRRGGGLRGGRAQRLRQHDDAFPVEGQHSGQASGAGLIARHR